MLRQAAANAWGVPVGECVAQQSRIVHPSSGRQARYGELAAAAAQLEAPTEVTLKKPEAWTLLGRPIPPVGYPRQDRWQRGFRYRCPGGRDADRDGHGLSGVRWQA